MAKKPGMAPKVLEYYPDAKSELIGGEYCIHSKGKCLGRSKSKSGAWRAAYNNINQ